MPQRLVDDKAYMFEWDGRYRVGVHSIDAQHQALFGIAQELYLAMSSGQGKSAIGRTLDRLAAYTSSHFAHEERLMQLHGYPELGAHQTEHRAFRAEIERLQSEFRSGRATMMVQVLQLLKGWLADHIQKSDQRLAPFLNP